jgi:2-polyprenyl-6-methoxyphenol hydroxylase-like FAD-dependent oxidoreductase
VLRLVRDGLARYDRQERARMDGTHRDRAQRGRSVRHAGHFVAAAAGPRSLYWYATVRGVEQDVADAETSRQRVLAHFDGCHSPVPDVIASTPASALFTLRLVDRAPLETWGRGRVTLLGDAVHPTTPDLAQGACQALEGAFVLGRTLGATRNVEQALHDYEAQHRPHATAATNRSWLITALCKEDGALFCMARDLLTGVFLDRIVRPELTALMRRET